MDKVNPLNQWEVDKWQVRTKGGNKMKKKEERTLLSFWLKTCSGGGESNSRERKSNFSLDFPVFG